ncbi:MAG: hypothetical protein HC764_17760 [Pleurocapsa sp. CRU_1_2]|nr:hypothetical protein [Pleurocapsa sp. CRU_1_2]
MNDDKAPVEEILTVLSKSKRKGDRQINICLIFPKPISQALTTPENL